MKPTNGASRPASDLPLVLAPLQSYAFVAQEITVVPSERRTSTSASPAPRRR